MPVQMTHPTFGTRTVDEDRVERYERTGWKSGPEVVPEVVDDTKDAVLAAVGDDPEKAREALVAEQSRTTPRKSLVTALARIAEPDTKES